MFALVVFLVFPVALVLSIEYWRWRQRLSGRSVSSLAPALFTSSFVLRTRRVMREAWRRLFRHPHTIELFVSCSDPHSYVLLQSLPALCSEFDVAVRSTIDVAIHVIDHLPPEVSVEQERWREWSLHDARQLASLYHLNVPRAQVPDAEALALAHQLLFSLDHNSPRFIELCIMVFNALWIDSSDSDSGAIDNRPVIERLNDMARRIAEEHMMQGAAILKPTLSMATGAGPSSSTTASSSVKSLSWLEAMPVVEKQLALNNELLAKRGHYLSAMIHYAGEWYWGVDRLVHLELRLMSLGLIASANDATAGTSPLSISLDRDIPPRFVRQHRLRSNDSETQLTPPTLVPLAPPVDTRLELFYSFRSPYSQLILERLESLASFYGVPLHTRPLLPMATRGYPVPLVKRLYILGDAKREADLIGVPFGRVHDPLGLGVERAMTAYYLLADQRKQLKFLLSWARYTLLSRSLKHASPIPIPIPKLTQRSILRLHREVWGNGVDSTTNYGMKRILGEDWSPEIELALDATDTFPELNFSKATPDAARLARNDEIQAAWKAMAEANRQQLLALGLWGVPVVRFVGPADATIATAWGQDRLWLIDRAMAEYFHNRENAPRGTPLSGGR